MHLFRPRAPGGAVLRSVRRDVLRCGCSLAAWAMAWPALLLAPLLAWGNPVSTENVTAHLLAEHNPAVPGQPLELLLSLTIRPGWHTYWRNPGDSGEAPRIDWTLPPGVSAGALQFPAPTLIRVGPLANFGYSGRALHPVPLSIPADWPLGEPIPVRAEAHWLVCEEHCVPESAVLELTLSRRRGRSDRPASAGGLRTGARRTPRGGARRCHPDADPGRAAAVAVAVAVAAARRAGRGAVRRALLSLVLGADRTRGGAALAVGRGPAGD